jgi:signal transduction histidine kinase
VNRMVSSARNTVRSMDEIVWAVNPENDTLDGLVAYLSQHVNLFFENTAVNCRLEMPVDLSSAPLSAELRHDLFLVVKEALNNILKHAQASEVRLRVLEDGPTVRIVIQDNGCGFEPNQLGPGRRGHGLGNMRQRMADLDGQFSIVSAPGSGTRIELAAPMDLKHRRP